MEKKLDLFGNLFIKSVRDNSLFVLEGVIDGHMKSSIDKEMHEQISKMSNNDILLLKEMAYRMVDLCLHNTLYMLEENQSWRLSSEEEGISNIADLSDGLSGELYTEDGWIRRYSQYPPSKGL
jgi:hypothetical protein